MRKAIPFLAIVGTLGAVLAGVAISDARARKAERAERVVPYDGAGRAPPSARLPDEGARRARAERMRKYTLRHGPSVAATPTPAVTAPHPYPIVQETLDEWALRHNLTTAQQQQVYVAIRDASVNQDRAERSALTDAIRHLPGPDPEPQWAEFAKTSRGDYTAPELYADIERIAGTAAAADFAGEFGDFMSLLLYQPAGNLSITYDEKPAR